MSSVHDLSAYSALPPAAINWLANGERGVSSNSLLSVMYDIDALGDGCRDAPHDPADLRRCRLLVDALPDGRTRLLSVSNVLATARSRVAILKTIEHWDVLCAVMDAEVPDYRHPEGRSAPKTYAAMKALVWDATAAAFDGVPVNIQALQFGQDKLDPSEVVRRTHSPEAFQSLVASLLACPVADKSMPGRVAFELLERARISLRAFDHARETLPTRVGEMVHNSLTTHSHVIALPSGKKQDDETRAALHNAMMTMWRISIGGNKASKLAGEVVCELNQKCASAIEMASEAEAQRAQKRRAKAAA